MAADLHIHAMDDSITEDDLAAFFGNTLGSKHFGGFVMTRTDGAYDKATAVISKGPAFWVGEVSWLKAALLEDASFIPEPVQVVSELIGERLPTLDPGLADKLETAIFGTPQKRATHYQVENRIEKWREFVKANLGRRLFCVSW